MKRIALAFIALALVTSVLACGPAAVRTASPAFIPLPAVQPGGGAETAQPGAGGLTPRPAGAATLPPLPILSTPVPTRTPAPTATSVAARFFWTPTPTGTAVPPTPRPALKGKLVFQTSSGGDIDLVNLDGTGLRTIATGLEPAWSPDGKLIAFTRWVAEDGPGVYVINADGTGQRRLYDLNNARSPAWSPDGKLVVVATRDERFRRVGFGSRTFSVEQDTWALVAIPVAGGDLIPVPADGEYYAFSPTWSVRGPIVYRGARGLYITGMGKEDQATILGDTPRPDSPTWSPDGSRLAFMMWQNDHWDIFTMDPAGGNERILTPPPAFLTRVPNNVAPSWSPDGKYILFLTDREALDHWDLYVMNADGSDQHKLMDVPLTYAANSERVVSWTR